MKNVSYFMEKTRGLFGSPNSMGLLKRSRDSQTQHVILSGALGWPKTRRKSRYGALQLLAEFNMIFKNKVLKTV